MSAVSGRGLPPVVVVVVVVVVLVVVVVCGFCKNRLFFQRKILSMLFFIVFFGLVYGCENVFGAVSGSGLPPIRPSGT